MRKAVVVFLTLFALSVAATGQNRTVTPPSLEGVWKVSEIVTTGANAATIRNPQPSVVIFARGHYSYLSVNGTQPRPKFGPARDPAKLTSQEMLAPWFGVVVEQDADPEKIASYRSGGPTVPAFSFSPLMFRTPVGP